MYRTLDSQIIELARSCNAPLYVVGGYVRNYLIDGSTSSDVDLASPMPAQEFLQLVESKNPDFLTVYKNTGTVTFSFSGIKYEYTQFRQENYVRGEHTPACVSFITDINLDALRRDFKCNAIYYDICGQCFVDPLGGMLDVKEKRLNTANQPDKVFASDGLRLMRLARFSAELGFKPSSKALKSARANAKNIRDISGERILEELNRILCANEKYSFSPQEASVVGLEVLKRIGVLDKILPVKKGKISAIISLPKELRLTALMLLVKNKQTEQALLRIKASAKLKDSVLALKKMHKSIKKLKKPDTIRDFLLDNYKYLQEFFKLKSVINQKKVSLIECEYRRAIGEGAPFTSPLAIGATQLIELGYKDKQISACLKNLRRICVKNPSLNNEKSLVEIVKNRV